MNEIIPPVDAPHGAYRERPVEPGRTALLCIDMQNGECGRPLRERAFRGETDPRHTFLYRQLEETVIPNQQRLLAACRRAGVEIVYTVIESLTRDGRDRSLDYKISGIHFPRGSWEARVIDEIAPGEDEIVLPKTSSSVFNSTCLEYVLRNLGVEYLVMIGIITEQCVESAIRDAADRGFMVTQVHDGCASYTERMHRQSTEAMRGHYCRTRSASEVIAELEALSGGTGADPDRRRT